MIRWEKQEFSHDGITHETYRQGTGPGVVVIHEIPGMTPEVIAFGQERGVQAVLDFLDERLS